MKQNYNSEFRPPQCCRSHAEHGSEEGRGEKSGSRQRRGRDEYCKGVGNVLSFPRSSVGTYEIPHRSHAEHGSEEGGGEEKWIPSRKRETEHCKGVGNGNPLPPSRGRGRGRGGKEEWLLGNITHTRRITAFCLRSATSPALWRTSAPARTRPRDRLFALQHRH